MPRPAAAPVPEAPRLEAAALRALARELLRTRRAPADALLDQRGAASLPDGQGVAHALAAASTAIPSPTSTRLLR